MTRISAAPDLYESLVAADDLLKAFVGPDDSLGQGVLRIAYDALNKARGDSA